MTYEVISYCIILMIRYEITMGTKGLLNQGLGAPGLRGPEPKCKPINEITMISAY